MNKTLLAVLTLSVLSPHARVAAAADEHPLDALTWRSIGPVNMSGRVADVEGIPGNPRVLFVGSASGGVWRTRNGGVTFEPIFDDQPIASIGDLALAPSNPDVIYVGSGESNVRNSVSFGNGVYKSTDGGDSFVHLGLDQTRHISRVVVHPTDPDTVYVGALGSVYAPSEHRGVYRSTDGGATWERVLHLDLSHGVADLDIDPHNPNVLVAAMWRFERKPWTHRSGSEEGGVFRSVDGGDTWTKVEDGLPKLLGRVGVKFAPSDPRVVYAIAESNEGTLFRSDDRAKTFRKVTDDVEIVSRGFYYTDLRVDPTDPDRLFAVASRMSRSIDGGRTFQRISRRTHVDYHSLWIDPLDPKRMVQGQDGGIALSHDGGETWDPVRNLPLAQFYQIFHTVNDAPFYRVGGGLQDNGTWMGPFRTREGAGVYPDLWTMFSFGDAYWVVPHPRDEHVFLSEYQAGGILRTHVDSGRQIEINPQTRRNDGGPVGDLSYRFNWNAPIVRSPHDPDTVYFAGNAIFRTRDFGDTWETISGDLTTNDPSKLGEAGGPAWKENTTAEYHCTVISFAESPRTAGELWAGSDDGRLQLSLDAGQTWQDRTGDLPVPECSPVSHIEPSRRADGMAWVAFDRHMFDDFAPHIFVTRDHGATWRRISDGLPANAWVWSLREDPKNPRLLYAGTELGLYATWDDGATWTSLDLGELPTVAVHDILVHPTENDLLIGTHGRAIWALDDATPIQQWSDATSSRPVHLFPARTAWRHTRSMTRYGLGDRAWVASNPPYGAILTYHLADDVDAQTDEERVGSDGDVASQRMRLSILDASGREVRVLQDAPTTKGLHRVMWDLTSTAPVTRDDEPQENEFGPPGGGPEVPPGVYTARLTLDGWSYETPVRVRLDPAVDADRVGLREEYRVARSLTDLLSSANERLRALDAVASQVDERRVTARRALDDLPDELDDALGRIDESIEGHVDVLARDPDKPFWSQGPRLTDRLRSLIGNVRDQYRAPTAAQKQHEEELRAEHRAAVDAIDRFLETDVPRLNDALEQHGLPPVWVPSPATDDDPGPST